MNIEPHILPFVSGVAAVLTAGLPLLKWSSSRKDRRVAIHESLLTAREAKVEALYTKVERLLDERLALIEANGNYRLIILKIPAILEAVTRCFESIPDHGKVEGLTELQKQIHRFSEDVMKVSKDLNRNSLL